MKPTTSAATAAAALALYAGLGAVFSGRPSGPELAAFRRLNRDAGAQPWLRLPQQLGTPWTLPLVGAIAAWRGERRLAVAALLALPTEKGAEVATKKLVERPRPAQVLHPRLRDDAPTEGPSFPSGHAAIATCAVWLLGWTVPTWATAVLASTAGLTAITRVHQGAHHPTDVVGGIALGIGIGAGLTTFVAEGHPHSPMGRGAAQAWDSLRLGMISP